MKRIRLNRENWKQKQFLIFWTSGVGEASLNALTPGSSPKTLEVWFHSCTWRNFFDSYSCVLPLFGLTKHVNPWFQSQNTESVISITYMEELLWQLFLRFTSGIAPGVGEASLNALTWGSSPNTLEVWFHSCTWRNFLDSYSCVLPLFGRQVPL